LVRRDGTVGESIEVPVDTMRDRSYHASVVKRLERSSHEL